MNDAVSTPTTTRTTIQCTIIIPHEGAHVAFSMEGFRTFLQQSNRIGGRSLKSPMFHTDSGGIWSKQIASPKEWSPFFIGSGYNIPQSLLEATQSFSTLKTNTPSSSMKRQLVNRYVLDSLGKKDATPR